MSLAIVGAIVGIASAGVGIAAAVGAFAPDNPGGNGTESSIAPKQQIIDLQTNLAALAETEKKTEQALADSKAAQQKWIYASAGLAIVAVVAGAFVVMNKNKSK